MFVPRLFEYIELLSRRSPAAKNAIVGNAPIIPDATVAFYHLRDREIMVDVWNTTKGGYQGDTPPSNISTVRNKLHPERL
jgi:hypothetical protein